jgi:hypothetical protein
MKIFVDVRLLECRNRKLQNTRIETTNYQDYRDEIKREIGI